MRLEDIKKTLQTARKRPGEEIRISRIEDLTPLNGYDPTKNPNQLNAHKSMASWILFGGAVGGGKTAWLVNEAIFHCLRYPGSRAFLSRHELASFKRTTFLTLMDFLPMDFIKRINKADNHIEFKNSSLLLCGGLGDDIRSIQKLKSMEISLWGIDQAEETTENFFHMLNSRLRLRIPGVKYRGLLTANPSSNWVRARFIDNQFEDHEFIPSLPKANPFLPSGYIERLRQTLPEELIRAWMEGDWDAISSESSVFRSEEIRAAMNRQVSKEGQTFISCDPARYGDDETVIVRKEGNHIRFTDIFSKRDTMFTVGCIIKAANRDKSIPIKIESVGVGGGVADRLKEQGYRVVEVIGSHSAKEGHIYKNRRAENYFNLKKLLPSLSIPNNEKLRTQMASIRYRTFSDARLLIETKDEIRKRGLPSPNRLDALVICLGEERLSKKEWELMLPFRSGRGPSLKTKKEREERAKQVYDPAFLRWLQKEKIQIMSGVPTPEIKE